MTDTYRLRQVVEETKVSELKIMCSGDLAVDWRDLRDLQTLEDGRSLKRTDDDKITNLAESLIRFGIVNNLQVWIGEQGEYFCFDAHHRVKAFAALADIGVEIPLLPATRCLAQDKFEAQRLLLVKESTASWVDVEVVSDYMRESGFAVEVAERTINIPGFEWDCVEEVAEKQKEQDEKAEQTPEIPGEVYIKKGDLIRLGRHRLLCGDSTEKGDVERLMNGEKIDMIFTDPPYGIDIVANSPRLRENKNLGSIGGSVIAQVGKYKPVENDDTMETAKKHLLLFPDIPKIIWGGNYFADFLPSSRGWIVWDKRNGDTNFADCELAYTSFDKSVRLYSYLWSGMRREGNRKEEGKSRSHPTQKPVGLIINILNDWAENFQIIFDGFLGSGSTMIAAEKTGRRCFGMEIDPHYCQISVQRWCDFTENYNISINGQSVDWRDISG